MRRIALGLLAVAGIAGVIACLACVSGQADEQAAPIFVDKIPAGYRDWKLISVAHEEGNLHSFAAVLGNDRRDQGLSGRETSVPGRRDHCRFALEARPVGGKQQSLRPFSIVRGRNSHERAVHGQRQTKVRRDGGLGFRSFQRPRRQTSGEGRAPIVLSLPSENESSRPRLHPLRTLIAKAEVVQRPLADGHSLDHSWWSRIESCPVGFSAVGDFHTNVLVSDASR